MRVQLFREKFYEKFFFRAASHKNKVEPQNLKEETKMKFLRKMAFPDFEQLLLVLLKQKIIKFSRPIHIV